MRILKSCHNPFDPQSKAYEIQETTIYGEQFKYVKTNNLTLTLTMLKQM